MAQLYELNLRDYWNIFLKRRLSVIISFFTVFISIFVYTSFQRPIYSATVLLKIIPTLSIPSEVVFPSSAQYWTAATTNLSDYTRQIVSRPVLELAGKNMGLITGGMTDKVKNGIISEMSAGVEAQEIEKTNMIRLQVSSQDPEKAANLANNIADAFKNINLEQKNQQAHNVRAFIEKTLRRISAKLKAQDARMRELTKQGVIGSGVNIVNQISELEKKRMDLMTKFTEKHPEVVRMDEEISELKGSLHDLSKEEFEYSILKRDITVNEALYTSLKQKLPEAQIKEAEKVDNVLIVNPAIPPRYPSYPNKAKNYAMALILGAVLGITVALVTEHIDTSIGRVDDIENFIKVSVVGVIPYCSSKTAGEDMERPALWKKMLGWIMGGTSFKRRHGAKTSVCETSVSAFDQPGGSIFLEAFRILSVNLQVLFGKGEKIKNKIILVTSCNPEEGKSVITSNLAVIMAQMGYKTLLIDGDSRRANIHKLFGLKSKEGGLLDILTGKVTFDSVVKTATDLMLGTTEGNKIIDRPWLNNLNILTAGSIFPNPINLFNSEKMDALLNDFRKRYDLILIDTSPILAVSEPSIMIPKVDGVLLVYKAGATSRLALRRAKIQIESVKPGSLSGIILNNVMPEVGIDAYYYYYRRYYGEKEKGAGKNA
jgi:tyrosine-protein kinase Etk/Wzc